MLEYLNWVDISSLAWGWFLACFVFALAIGVGVSVLVLRYFSENAILTIFIALVVVILVYLGTTQVVMSDIMCWFEAGVEVTKEEVVVDNVDNKFMNIDYVVVKEKRHPVSYLEDTKFVKNTGGNKIILEIVTYKATEKWCIPNDIIDELNSTTKYFIKEVHRKEQ